MGVRFTSAGHRPLLGDAARRPAMVVIVLAVLGVHYAHHDLPGALDRRLDGIGSRLSPQRSAAHVLIGLGNPVAGQWAKCCAEESTQPCFCSFFVTVSKSSANRRVRSELKPWRTTIRSRATFWASAGMV